METRKILMPHQVDALEWSRERQQVPFLMQMRLGKTLCAIRQIEARKQIEKKSSFMTLIIGPSNVLPNWEKELTLEGHAWSRAYRLPNDEMRANVELAHMLGNMIVLINYEALNRYPEICSLNWDMVVLDESTKIKNPGARVSKLCTQTTVKIKDKEYVGAFPFTENRLILTGAISPENALEVFQQMKFTYGSFMGYNDYYKFRDAFFTQVGFKYEPKRWAADRIKDEVHRLSFVLTREQAGIGEKKIYDRRYTFLEEGEQEEMYRKIEEEFYYELQKDDGSKDFKATMFKLVTYQWLAKLCGGFTPETKAKNLSDIFKPLSEQKANLIWDMYDEEMSGEQAVIWCRYRHEVLHLRRFLKEKGLGVSIAMGQLDIDKEIRPDQDKFNEGKNKIMIATTKFAKFGADYSAADTAIYYSNDPSGEARIQSEDRIVHPKKKRPLYYIDLVVQDTIDEDLADLMKRKVMNSSDFMDIFKTQFTDRMNERMRNHK